MSDHPNVALITTDDIIREAMQASYRHELVQNHDGTWFAKVVELPGCMTEGDTAAEALENLKDAMRGWLRVQIEDGDPIPQPWAEAQYSGKFMVRIPPRLHRDIAECAARERVSLNAFALTALARAVGTTSQNTKYLAITNQISVLQAVLPSPSQPSFSLSTLAFSSELVSTVLPAASAGTESFGRPAHPPLPSR